MWKFMLVLENLNTKCKDIKYKMYIMIFQRWNIFLFHFYFSNFIYKSLITTLKFRWSFSKLKKKENIGIVTFITTIFIIFYFIKWNKNNINIKSMLILEILYRDY